MASNVLTGTENGCRRASVPVQPFQASVRGQLSSARRRHANLELMRVDPIPNLGFEKPTGNQGLIPENVRRETIFCQKIRRSRRAIELDSSVRSIVLQMAQ